MDRFSVFEFKGKTKCWSSQSKLDVYQIPSKDLWHYNYLRSSDNF